MGFEDRDYTRRNRGDAGVFCISSLLPRAAVLVLLVLHVLGFIVVLALRHDQGPTAATMFVLQGSASHPLAILLHPAGDGSVTKFVLVGLAIWSLGSSIESRLGSVKTFLLYALGVVLGGAVYFAFAQAAPDLSRLPLAIPAGGLAAWVPAARRVLAGSRISLRRRTASTPAIVTAAAAIVAATVFFFYAEAATAWLLAAVAGSLSWLAVAVSSKARTHPPRRPGIIDDPDIDEILAKISREGIDSLTTAERNRLELARRRRRHGR